MVARRTPQHNHHHENAIQPLIPQPPSTPEKQETPHAYPAAQETGTTSSRIEVKDLGSPSPGQPGGWMGLIRNNMATGQSRSRMGKRMKGSTESSSRTQSGRTKLKGQKETPAGPPRLRGLIAGPSLAGQFLRLHASTAGGTGSIPGQGTKFLHVV